MKNEEWLTPVGIIAYPSGYQPVMRLTQWRTLAKTGRDVAEIMAAIIVWRLVCRQTTTEINMLLLRSAGQVPASARRLYH